MTLEQIVRDLRAWSVHQPGDPLIAAAADTIERQQQELAQLRQLLQPFTDYAEGWHENWPDTIRIDETDMDECPTLGDCRRAREVLERICG